MIPKWREMVIGFLAERANSIIPTYLDQSEAKFINRLLDGMYPLPNTQEFTTLLERMEKPGFDEYAAAFYRRFQRVVEGYENEIALPGPGALALIQMATNPEALARAWGEPDDHE